MPVKGLTYLAQDLQHQMQGHCSVTSTASAAVTVPIQISALNLSRRTRAGVLVNGVVVEPVNSAYTIYHSDGSVVAGPFNVNRLFKEGFKQFTSDPRCYFDKSTHTWFAIILFINSTGPRARTDLAVNPSGDPTTSWTVYHLDATDNGSNGTPKHPGCPCLGDQPLLGIDQQNVLYQHQ